MCKSRYREHTEPLFKQLKCLKFDDIVYTKTSNIMYKAHCDLLPRNIQLLFTKGNTVHSYSTRQQGNLHVQATNTTLKQKCVSYIGTKIWNNLNQNIKCSRSIKTFQNKVKTMIINQYVKSH